MKPLHPILKALPVGVVSVVRNWGQPTEQGRRLADILEIAPESLASVRIGSAYYYRPFTVEKADKRERRILEPSPRLKQLQRRLLERWLQSLPIHRCATAFRAGFSTVENARRHARQSLIATLDVRDFFESTSAGRIRAFFARQGWRDDALATLMRLCVYRNGLPQGSPTSPCLSNLVNVTVDDQLCKLTERSGGIYTRYGDDLTFSWTSGPLPRGIQIAVEEVLHRAGYEIQPRKGWRVYDIRENPSITGLVLGGNGRLRIPWRLRWNIWRLRWKCFWQPTASDRARLEGYRGYCRQVW